MVGGAGDTPCREESGGPFAYRSRNALMPLTEVEKILVLTSAAGTPDRAPGTPPTCPLLRQLLQFRGGAPCRHGQIVTQGGASLLPSACQRRKLARCRPTSSQPSRSGCRAARRSALLKRKTRPRSECWLRADGS